MKTNICTINDLKLMSTISENVDCNLLTPFLNISQELYTMPVLGQALYDDLITKLDNNTLNAGEQLLITEYIIPAIAYGSWYASAPFIAYKTQRTGISKMNSDVLTALEPAEMSIYMTKLENLKAFYLNRLENYLIQNASTFTLFRRNCTSQSNGGSIYLGFKTRKSNEYWDSDNGTIPSMLKDTESDCPDC